MIGFTVHDRITGFTGVVTGTASYISGCSQALVAPRCKAGGDFVESQWFDMQRLEIVEEVEPIALDNGGTPGPDRAPPKR